MNVVIDTNVVIAALRNPGSAAGRIIDMAIAGEIQPLGSLKTKQETARLVQRAGLGREAWLKADRLLYRTREVAPHTGFSISTDRSDNLYFEAAHAGGAQFIVTSDRHLLDHDGFWGIRVVRPADFLRLMANHNK
ncbi:MAG: putative toxin-antitoxin system toxin component, PIN family [Candidatus Aenigmarchaeota archaeon]|nr:putative toxin-antitoxin system toxin component, PIN family [Candidatus Aenigmarchaeota archaeon]